MENPIITNAIDRAHNELDSFIQLQNNPVKASQSLNSLLDVLHQSSLSMENHLESFKLSTGEPEVAEIEKVMQAIHDIESFGMQSKTVQEKVNVLNATFFWDKLKAFKEDLGRISKRGLKRGERVEKVEKVNKSRKASDQRDR